MSLIRRPALWIAVCALAFLHGCTLLPPLGESGAPGDRPRSIESGPSEQDLPQLLHFYHKMAVWPETFLQSERRIQQAALAAGRCDLARLKLGLVLLRFAERGIEFEPADTLLKPCLQQPALADSGIQDLALLLSTQLQQSVARRSAAQANARQLDVMKKENQELKRQLEGLKAIERSLQDRRRR